MGFYIELRKAAATGEYREEGTPPVFWTLYLIAGFAIFCMAAAAHSLLGDLLRMGSYFDLFLVGSFIAVIPIYFLIGIKLLSIRRFVSFAGDRLECGFKIGKKTLFGWELPRAEIDNISLVNKIPSPNLARKYHDDPQYQIRGHWRVVAKTKAGEEKIVDRHTEKGALEGLQKELTAWVGEASAG